jgi:hypothetical protein
MGCDARAVRIPNGAVSASTPAVGSERTPAKTSNIAAVRIRIMTPTQSCLTAATSPIAAPTSTAREVQNLKLGCTYA